MMQEKQNKGKLAPKWLGPYTVIDSQPNSPNLTILKKNKPVKLHKNLFKKFRERDLTIFQNHPEHSTTYRTFNQEP